MTAQYGPEKGERVFYASENAGRITGVHKEKPSRPLKRRLTQTGY